MERMKLYAWILIVAALVIQYFIARRRFNRRGVGGLQHYNSFEKAVVTGSIEKAGKWISILMLVSGLVILLMLWTDKKLVERNREKVPTEQSGDSR